MCFSKNEKEGPKEIGYAVQSLHKRVNKFVNQVHDWGFAQKFGIMKLPEGDDASDESGNKESNSEVKDYLKLLDKIHKLAQML